MCEGRKVGFYMQNWGGRGEYLVWAKGWSSQYWGGRGEYLVWAKDWSS